MFSVVVVVVAVFRIMNELFEIDIEASSLSFKTTQLAHLAKGPNETTCQALDRSLKLKKCDFNYAKKELRI